MTPLQALLLGVSAVAAVLAAAKAHGRQVRLVRERAGIHEVEFGGANPPLVEALWRKDRVRFWTAYPVLAVVFGGAAYAFVCPCVGGAAWALVGLAAGPWAFSVAFFVAGIPHVRETAPEALAASVAWWSAAAALVALSVLHAVASS